MPWKSILLSTPNEDSLPRNGNIILDDPALVTWTQYERHSTEFYFHWTAVKFQITNQENLKVKAAARLGKISFFYPLFVVSAHMTYVRNKSWLGAQRD